MDPFSIAGLGLSTASLSFQVFAGCIKGYQLLSEAKDMPKDCQYLRVRLEMEHHRLLDWSEVAGLVAADGSVDLSKNLQIKRHLLLDILTVIRTALDEFGKVKGRYKELQPLDDADKPTEVKSPTSPSTSAETPKFSRRFPRGSSRALNKALDFIDHAPQTPRRLRWVVFDKEKFTGLLNRLTELNDFLHGLMDDSQTRALHHTQHQTYMEILQLHNNIEDLKQLVRALSVSDTNGARRSGFALESVPASAAVTHRDEEKQNLARLARFKVLNTDMEGSVSKATLESTQLERRHLKIAHGSASSSAEGRIEAIYRPSNNTAKHVWIEWKYYESDRPEPDRAPDPRVVVRVQQLAALLGETNKPEEFRSPRCLGYYFDNEETDDDEDDDHGGTRFGFVFEKPSGVRPAAKIISLLELINSTPPNTGPSLTERIALASKIANCIHYLHSVNWLHKGLRSHNILFFHDHHETKTAQDKDQASINLEQPYLSGFDYARPAQSGELTEQPPENAAHDIYRHPHVHGSGGPREGFKKSFDVYSLGIILLEIAHWKPIDTIMGISDLTRAKPAVITRVRESILSERKYLDGVRFAMGDMYRDVVKACIAGGKELGIPEPSTTTKMARAQTQGTDEALDTVGALIQVGFYDRVVKRLAEMRV